MKTKRPLLLVVSSALMLVIAIPMLMWCFTLINGAAVDMTPGYTYAGVGCFAAAIVYTFSMLTAIAGLTFAKRPYYRRWCRAMGLIQLIASVILVIPMRAYVVLTLPPLLILTMLYLIGARKRAEDDF
ncbi:MAG: hypothetical protein M0P14_04175 [Alkaliphilus sp.]|nr:hypothetical protein [Alkaliphilus sp.]